MVRKIILMTLSIEFCAGTILAAYFFTQNGWIGIYQGYWHAVSAFTNCGMDIMGNDVGFAGMAANPLVSTVVCISMFLGGVGFIALDDLFQYLFSTGALSYHKPHKSLSTFHWNRK